MATAAVTKFIVDHAKRVSNCKKCRVQIAKGELRLAKLVPNYFASDSANAPELKQYFHPRCLFETFERARATTKVIESAGDIDGWNDISDGDKDELLELIKKLSEQRSKSSSKSSAKSKTEKQSNIHQFASPSKRDAKKDTSVAIKKVASGAAASISKSSGKKEEKSAKIDLKKRSEKMETGEKSASGRDDKEDLEQNLLDRPASSETKNQSSKFDSFKLFCKLCEVISKVPKYTEKSSAVSMFIKKDGYDGDLFLLIKLLLPGTDQRVYNLKEKQLIKLFANMYSWDVEELTDDFNHSGDVSLTIRKFYEKTDSTVKKSQLTIQQVDAWLDKLAKFTKEDKKQDHFLWLSKRVSPLELQYVLRLIKKDLRINAGAKHILEGVRPGAYESFQNSRDLRSVIDKCSETGSIGFVQLEISLGVPVKPMLAEPCRSVEQAMKRCTNGMYSEIKYDGERIQLHKNGDNFSFFSRSLKPVMEHKVAHLREFIPKAFPSGNDMILDAEVLMVDTDTGKPLPFGTLGVHKKENFATAVECIFIFDCVYFNGESLMSRPLKDRKALLEKNIKEIPNRILLSNYQIIAYGENTKLKEMIWKAIDEGLEGLVMKDVDSIYEPGKRHWLKVKKDYLEDGKMADTADLIVLGAYYGTGAKGGLMSVFLMGVYDTTSKKFLTVTKCGNGHDDATLDRINKKLRPKMKKISRDYDNLPQWLTCSRSLVPDFVIQDPHDAPVWEITGAEFSRADNHTAGGISIRFPRVTKIRDDKNWESATNLAELKNLFDISKQKSDLDLSFEDSIPLFTKEVLNNPYDDNTTADLGVITKEIVKRHASEDDSGNAKKRRASGESSDDVKKRRISESSLGDVKKRHTNEDSLEDVKKRHTSEGSPGDVKKQRTSEDSLGDGPSSSKKRSTRGEDDESYRRNQSKEEKTRKPPCKYGAECYRKNPSHFEEYTHPAKK